MQTMEAPVRKKHGFHIAAFLLALLVAAGAFGVTEQAKEQARLIDAWRIARLENGAIVETAETGTDAADGLAADGRKTAAGSAGAPLSAETLRAHQAWIVQFVEEAGGIYSARAREAVMRAVRSARDAQLRLAILIWYLFAVLAVWVSRKRYVCLPGVFSLSSERVILSYLHDQDGSK